MTFAKKIGLSTWNLPTWFSREKTLVTYNLNFPHIHIIYITIYIIYIYFLFWMISHHSHCKFTCSNPTFLILALKSQVPTVSTETSHFLGGNWRTAGGRNIFACNLQCGKAHRSWAPREFLLFLFYELCVFFLEVNSQQGKIFR